MPKRPWLMEESKAERPWLTGTPESVVAKMRFEPTEARPSATATPGVFEPMYRQMEAEFAEKPRFREREELTLPEAAESVFGGFTHGATFGIATPWEEEFSDRLSYQIMKYIVPFGAATKGYGLAKAGLGKLSLLNKVRKVLPVAIKKAFAGGTTFAGAEAGLETGRAIRGEGFDVGKVLTSGTAGAVIGGVGGAIIPPLKAALKGTPTITKPLVKPAGKYVEASKVAEEVRSEAAKKLVVNETYAPTPASMKPYKILRYPSVKAEELDKIMKIPQQKPVVSIFGKYKEAVLNPIRMHESYGTKELMYHPVRAAENRATVLAKQAINQFEKVRKQIPLGKRAESSKRIMIYAVAQQKNGVKILNEMGIKEIPVLTSKEWAAYKYMRSELQSLYNQLQQARMASGVKPFPKVENYFTFFRNLEGELQAGRDLLHMNPNKLRWGRLRAEKTPFRFAKKRMVDDYGPLKLDAFAVFENYLRSARHHIELTPQIAKVRQLLDGKFINKFSLVEANPEAYRQLNNWINFVSGVDVHNLPAPVERGLRALNRNLAYSVLSYNLRSAAIQPSAMVNSITELGPKWMLEGNKGLFDRKIRHFIMKNSNTLASRQHDIAITEAMEGLTGKLAGAKRWVGTKGLWPLQALDLETAKATWWGAYQKAIKVFKYTRKEAIEYADDVVVKTQASAARVDLAPIQRSALGKSLSVFQTFVINNWGFLTKDVAGIGNPAITNKQAFKKVLTYLVSANIINTIYEDALGTRSPFPAPIHEFRRRLKAGDSEAKALYKSMLEFAEPLPLFGGGVRYGSHPAGATLQLMGDIGKALYDPEITAREVEAVGKAVGVPATTQLRKFYTQSKKREKR